MAQGKVSLVDQIPEIQAVAAHLLKVAEQFQLKLPEDAALTMARGLRNDASGLRRAFKRLIAYSTSMGTETTAASTQRVLQESIGEIYKVPGVYPAKLWRRFVTEKTQVQDWSADCQAVFSVLKIQDGIKVSEARQQLEVNMRESERDGLGRRHAFERDGEIRIKNRKAG